MRILNIEVVGQEVEKPVHRIWNRGAPVQIERAIACHHHTELGISIEALLEKHCVSVDGVTNTLKIHRSTTSDYSILHNSHSAHGLIDQICDSVQYYEYLLQTLLRIAEILPACRSFSKFSRITFL